jgi:hypothetical protein
MAVLSPNCIMLRQLSMAVLTLEKGKDVGNLAGHEGTWIVHIEFLNGRLDDFPAYPRPHIHFTKNKVSKDAN